MSYTEYSVGKTQAIDIEHWLTHMQCSDNEWIRKHTRMRNSIRRRYMIHSLQQLQCFREVSFRGYFRAPMVLSRLETTPWLWRGLQSMLLVSLIFVTYFLLGYLHQWTVPVGAEVVLYGQ